MEKIHGVHIPETDTSLIQICGKKKSEYNYLIYSLQIDENYFLVRGHLKKSPS